MSSLNLIVPASSSKAHTTSGPRSTKRKPWYLSALQWSAVAGPVILAARSWQQSPGQYFLGMGIAVAASTLGTHSIVQRHPTGRAVGPALLASHLVLGSAVTGASLAFAGNRLSSLLLAVPSRQAEQALWSFAWAAASIGFSTFAGKQLLNRSVSLWDDARHGFTQVQGNLERMGTEQLSSLKGLKGGVLSYAALSFPKRVSSWVLDRPWLWNSQSSKGKEILHKLLPTEQRGATLSHCLKAFMAAVDDDHARMERGWAPEEETVSARLQQMHLMLEGASDELFASQISRILTEVKKTRELLGILAEWPTALADRINTYRDKRLKEIKDSIDGFEADFKDLDEELDLLLASSDKKGDLHSRVNQLSEVARNLTARVNAANYDLRAFDSDDEDLKKRLKNLSTELAGAISAKRHTLTGRLASSDLPGTNESSTDALTLLFTELTAKHAKPLAHYLEIDLDMEHMLYRLEELGLRSSKDVQEHILDDRKWGSTLSPEHKSQGRQVELMRRLETYIKRELPKRNGESFLRTSLFSFQPEDFRDLRQALDLPTSACLATALADRGLKNSDDFFTAGIVTEEVENLSKPADRRWALKAALTRHINKNRDLRSRVYRVLSIGAAKRRASAAAKILASLAYRVSIAALVIAPMAVQPTTAATGALLGAGYDLFKRLTGGLPIFEELADNRWARDANSIVARRNLLHYTSSTRRDAERFTASDIFGRMRILSAEAFISLLITYWEQKPFKGFRIGIFAQGFFVGRELMSNTVYLSKRVCSLS